MSQLGNSGTKIGLKNQFIWLCGTFMFTGQKLVYPMNPTLHEWNIGRQWPRLVKRTWCITGNDSEFNCLLLLKVPDSTFSSLDNALDLDCLWFWSWLCLYWDESLSCIGLGWGGGVDDNIDFLLHGELAVRNCISPNNREWIRHTRPTSNCSCPSVADLV